MQKITLREIKKEDKISIFKWSNLKSIRNYSLSKNRISLKEHEKWFNRKLKSKNLDAIVMNSLKNSGAGFSGDTNKVSYISRKEEIINFELKLKNQVAEDIFTQILKNE